MREPGSAPILAFTQGDPGGVGPQLLLKMAGAGEPKGNWRPVWIAERAALEALGDLLPGVDWDQFHYFRSSPTRREILDIRAPKIPVVDPLGSSRKVTPGQSGPDDAAGAVAALDLGMALARSGTVDALITGPVSKESIARHRISGFLGHTEYMAEICGLERYGADYLMTFLAADLQVALLTTHQPLSQSVSSLQKEAIVEALRTLHKEAGGRIAVAGLNPHAGEGGLLGDEEERIVKPAIEQARVEGIDAIGPESPDSVFALARRGLYDWVLALYHDQGLIAVKTAGFGTATNWTLGLPFLRTSVDHGTAFDVAATGEADVRPVRQVVRTTLELLAGRLPRGRSQPNP